MTRAKKRKPFKMHKQSCTAPSSSQDKVNPYYPAQLTFDSVRREMRLDGLVREPTRDDVTLYVEIWDFQYACGGKSAAQKKNGSRESKAVVWNERVGEKLYGKQGWQAKRTKMLKLLDEVKQGAQSREKENQAKMSYIIPGLPQQSVKRGGSFAGRPAAASTSSTTLHTTQGSPARSAWSASSLAIASMVSSPPPPSSSPRPAALSSSAQARQAPRPVGAHKPAPHPSSTLPHPTPERLPSDSPHEYSWPAAYDRAQQPPPTLAVHQDSNRPVVHVAQPRQPSDVSSRLADGDDDGLDIIDLCSSSGSDSDSDSYAESDPGEDEVSVHSCHFSCAKHSGTATATGTTASNSDNWALPRGALLQASSSDDDNSSSASSVPASSSGDNDDDRDEQEEEFLSEREMKQAALFTKQLVEDPGTFLPAIKEPERELAALQLWCIEFGTSLTVLTITETSC